MVIVTPTASGKTLCYNLPVLNRIAEDPGARACTCSRLRLWPKINYTNCQTAVDAMESGIRVFARWRHTTGRPAHC